MTKSRNFADLTQNPCKMCMPMGAMLAFKGIEGSMTLIHGSQGCSTYIRRHMAGHFNEPVDIASSSLNEQGTVHGGAANMKKALGNLIRLYNPSIIGVATTCLAETIGEDINRITREFREEWALEGKGGPLPVLVPVQTPGYGGTQFEGWFAALLSLVKTLVPEKIAEASTPGLSIEGIEPSYVADDMKSGEASRTTGASAASAESLPRINLILPNLSPADIRNLKAMLAQFPLQTTLLPDLSETLDGPWKADYTRIPEGGTTLDEIRSMGKAMLTIEFGTTVPDALSPGLWLEEHCGVPLVRLPLPVGLEATDRFLEELERITGSMPAVLERERGRLLDAMVDSHKHLGEGRACVYGVPEMVAAIARLYMENGLRPVLSATGAVNPKFRKLLAEMADNWPTLWEGETPEHIDDTDFATIRDKCREKGVTLLTGGSEGRLITERDGIPLVRVGFPIHDRIGGQRVLITGYNGATALMDNAANALLERKYGTYRARMHSSFYESLAGGKEVAMNNTATPIAHSAKTIEERTAEHPCYGASACKNARMHLPVAPACNISCNYCNRKFDCVNESRPGVTSEILNAEAAVAKYLTVREKVPNLKVVGIAGPGDALANFDAVRETLKGIRAVDPDVTFCLSTNGLMLPFHARELIELGVTHITVTMNTIDPKIGARIYREVHYLGKRLAGIEAATVLLKNQLDGIRFLSSAGIKVKVNIVMMKGLNETGIPDTVKAAKECGAFMTNIMPLIPAPGSAFEHRPMTGNVELNEMRKACEIDLKQMYHCRQCRADAIGMLSEDVSAEFRTKPCAASEPEEPAPSVQEPRKPDLYAIATKTGLMIDAHFGQVEEFRIYRFDGVTPEFVETRRIPKYCSGAEDCGEETHDDRIGNIIRTIGDCRAVLALRIGNSPSEELEKQGIMPIMTCGSFADGLAYALEHLTQLEKMKQETA